MKNRESGQSDLYQEIPNFITFITLWDEDLGPKLYDIFPAFNIGDAEKISISIFQVYQYFYSSEEQGYNRVFFTLPINKLNKKAKILFDSYPNQEVRGGFQPFFVTLLVPPYFTDKELEFYEEYLLKIAQEFRNTHKVDLAEYEEMLKNITSIEEKSETKVEIDEYYSYTAAMEDFEAGIRLFKGGNYSQAKPILQKVLKKFEIEEHLPLVMEVRYILGTLFIQEGKFRSALEHFQKLNQLSIKLENEKYLEISTFMKAFINYKLIKYAEALSSFKKLEIKQCNHINKLQAFTIKGRTLAQLNYYEKALQYLLKALVISTEQPPNPKIMHQQARLLYDLGVIHYRMGINIINSKGLGHNEEYLTYFQEAIRHFKRASEAIEKTNNLSLRVNTFKLIGEIYEFLGNDNEFLSYYRNAYNISKDSKENINRSSILYRIIQKQLKMNSYEKAVPNIQDLLTQAAKSQFFDSYRIANLHKMLGMSFLNLDNYEKALKELKISYELFAAFEKPLSEQKEILKELIEIHSKLKNHEKMEEYKLKLEKVSNDMKNIEIEQPKSYKPMGEVKEIWVFSKDTGIKLYNYSPESNINDDLLGGFLTALQNFSLEIRQKEFDSLIIGNDRYMIFQKEGREFYILGRANASTPEELMKRILSIIYKRFWQEYSEEIKKFQGNISPFRSFTQIIESLDLSLV